jgi:hypothetical protein
MSELTPCNHCTLLAIRRQARKMGRKVTLCPSPLGTWENGQDVYVHPRNVKKMTKEYWIAWLAEIPEHCIC